MTSAPMRSPYDSIGVAISVCSFIAATISPLRRVAREVGRRFAAELGVEQRPADLEHRARNAFAGVIRIAARYSRKRCTSFATGATEAMPTMCSSLDGEW